MADPQFTAPQKRVDAITGLHHVEYTVTGNDADPVVTGVGDNGYQAKRNAVVKYRKRNPLAFLDIPES